VSLSHSLISPSHLLFPASPTLSGSVCNCQLVGAVSPNVEINLFQLKLNFCGVITLRNFLRATHNKRVCEREALKWVQARQLQSPGAGMTSTHKKIKPPQSPTLHTYLFSLCQNNQIAKLQVLPSTSTEYHLLFVSLMPSLSVTIFSCISTSFCPGIPHLFRVLFLIFYANTRCLLSFL